MKRAEGYIVSFALLMALLAIPYFSSKQEAAWVTYTNREYRVLVDRKQQTLELECWPCVSATLIKQRHGQLMQTVVVAHKGPSWPLTFKADRVQSDLWQWYFGDRSSLVSPPDIRSEPNLRKINQGEEVSL